MLDHDWTVRLRGLMPFAEVLDGTADSVAALCAQLNLPDGATGTSTIEAKTNFFAAVREGVITITATPLHAGSSTIVVQTDVHRGDGVTSAGRRRPKSVLT